MNFIRFLLVFFLFILVNAYLFIRGWQALPNRIIVHIVYAVVFLLAAFGVFIGLFLGSKLPVWASYGCELIGGYWIILFVYFLFAALLGDMIRIADHLFHLLPGWISDHYARVKLGYFISVLLILGVMSVIGYIRFSHPRIVTIELPFGNSHNRSADMTLVAASDIHLGNLIRKGRLADWIELINRQKPDVILLPGDIFDHNMHAVESQNMDKELVKLNATYGVYAVPGNHDFYAGIDKAVAYMNRSGMHVLRDQTAIIDDRLVIIGRDDLTNRHRKTLDSLIAGLDSGLFRIVLDHQPVRLQESVANHIDLQLSGHTHDGQVFPFNHIITSMYDLGYGYRKTGHTHFYVSSGLGLWGAPMRIGTQSEIVVIKLRASGSQNIPH
jgi:predicted MPP superfamily phosphohydrolase